MEFSHQWKSLFPIGKVSNHSLLLISENHETLGPLFFNPKPQTTALLFDSPSLISPPPTRRDPASLPGPHFQDFLSHNRLQLLKVPGDNSLLVFFQTGPNSDRVGFLLLSLNEKALVATGNEEGSVFIAGESMDGQILRILVQPVDEGNDNVFGYLLVCTMFSVYWICVQKSEITNKVPVFACRCHRVFTTGLVVAAWSPHIPEQSIVLLDNGSLFLFDLSCSDGFSGKKLDFSWDDPVKKCKWVGCEFSWHPQILVVARSDAVFIVDWRSGVYKVVCLAKTNMFGPYASAQTERFLAFSKAASSDCHFVLASDSMLALCDVRMPLTPLLLWAHGQSEPRYIDVFRLSQLRSNSGEKWATASGFAIVLGSFWHCEFSFFCYGPSPEGSSSSQVSKLMYAWQLPSEFSLSGRECKCGDCLVKEEFAKDDLPEWVDWQLKKDMVLGFGFLSLSSLLFEPDDEGFTLIRLMSSGKLESQRYSAASRGFLMNSDILHGDPPLSFSHNLLNGKSDGEYNFSKRSTYYNFDDNLPQVLDSSIVEPYDDNLPPSYLRKPSNISNRRSRKYKKQHTDGDGDKSGKSNEAFDDICPVSLKFDDASIETENTGLQILDFLKKYPKWNENSAG